MYKLTAHNTTNNKVLCVVHRCYIVSSDLSDIEINVAKLLVGLIDSEVQLEQHLHIKLQQILS